MSRRTPSTRGRSTTGNARLAAALSVVSAAVMASVPLTAAPATAASLGTWEKVAQCESSGNWQAYNPAGPYYGGLQFAQSTWKAYGGLAYADRADHATKRQQVLIAEKVLAGQGERAWPRCGPAARLGSDHGTPYPTPVPPVSVATGPGTGAMTTGTVELTASVTDAVGTPVSATFFVDGTAVGTDSGHGPAYRTTLDTRTLADGPHTLTVRAANDAGQTGPLSAAVPFYTANRATATQASGDFDGDGKDDIGVLYDYGQEADGANHAALWTFTANGSGFGEPVKVWDNVEAGTGSWNWGRSKVTTGDFDGDGKADIAVLYNDGQDADGTNHTALWTFTSTGSGFKKPVRTWQSTTSWSWDRSKVTSGDFDGDGKADVGILYNGGQQADGKNMTALWTLSSTGSGFAGPVKKWDNDDRTTGSWSWDRSKVTSGDFDGDGKVDVGILYNGGQQADGKNTTALWTLTSTGSGFTRATKKWDSGSDSWNADASKVTSGDFNGDGKTDLGVLYHYGKQDNGANSTGLWSFTSTGSGFAAPVKNWESAQSWNWFRSDLA
ncbi:transglycosylase family protein [Streptomyces monomycini]|uniref:transglycosylase family protein n=1 Tax=Streptomyces monomycini TaxID=371720 RepID=UPI0004AAF082|nr:transglycosylase family protein [Streptomyces monomycini]